MTKLIAIALAFAMAAASIVVWVKLREPWIAADLLMISAVLLLCAFFPSLLRGDAE